MDDPTILSDQDYEALLDAAAKIHGITIQPEWRAMAILNLKITGDAAKFVEAFALDDEAEPASIFVA
jgi:hypothetical protein